MTATPLFTAINSIGDADKLCAMLEERQDALEAVIREETNHLASARLADAFALHQRKTMEARSYEEGLSLFKHNAVALARFEPAGLDRIKKRQSTLQSALEANLQTLQTLKTVSENILRGVATEVSRSRTLSTYGSGGQFDAHPVPSTSRALMVSAKF